jgi:hypothetical protein
MTDKYKFDYAKLNVPSNYTELAKLANCVQSKSFFNIWDKSISPENAEGICSIDIHNLPLLHYLSFTGNNLEFDTIINGFCIHQGIGFTIIVNDISFHKYNLSQQLDILEKCKTILRVIYDATVSENR